MNEFSIVIPSCDKYSDVWVPLLKNLEKKWPDNTLRIYLISNFKKIKFRNVINLRIGQDKSWSDNLKNALEFIPEKNIFLLIDDLFFINIVDNKKVLFYLELFQRKNMDYFRFNPTPPPNVKTEIDKVGIIKPGSYYRSSTVLSLWKKSVLVDVLKENESAWEFELLGAKRTDRYIHWYASNETILPYYNLIIKGKYDPLVYEKIIKGGISLDRKRSRMNKIEYIFFKIKKIRSILFSFLPTKYKRKIREVLIRL